MISDKDLKINQLYWCEIIDPQCTQYFGKQLIVKSTGIQFREVDDKKAIKDKRNFLLPQLKIFREAKEMDRESTIL